MNIYSKEYFRTIKRSMLYAGLVLGVCSYLPPAMAASGGTPAYQIQSIPFQWVDAKTGTKQATGTMIPIGFSFNYYGVTYSSLAIGGRGDLALGAYDPNVDYQATAIMPYFNWGLYSYAYSDIGRGVYTKLEGIAPNRKFTVSWVDVSFIEIVPPCDYDTCTTDLFGKVSFQATLYEGSNDIVYRYLDLIASDEAGAGYANHDNGAGAKVSVANTGRNEGTIYSVGQTPINSGTALRFFIGSPANLSPIADAGLDLTVNQRDTVILNGSGSRDPNGTIASYLWAQDYNGGPTISIANATTTIASFIAPPVASDTVVTVKLKVTDNQGAYSTDRANVTIRKTP